MGMALNTNLPELFAKVEELMKQAAALQQTKSVIMVKDVPKPASTPRIPQEESEPIEGLPKTEESTPSSDTQQEADASETSPSPETPEGGEAEAEEVPTKLELFDPTQLEAKLDALMTLCQELRVVPQPQMQPSTPVVGESPKTPLPGDEGATVEQLDVPASSEDGGLQPASDLVSQNAEVSQSVAFLSTYSRLIVFKQLQEVLELLKGDIEQRAAQGDQQLDSVRYLNELNSVSDICFAFSILKC